MQRLSTKSILGKFQTMPLLKNHMLTFLEPKTVLSYVSMHPALYKDETNANLWRQQTQQTCPGEFSSLTAVFEDKDLYCASSPGLFWRVAYFIYSSHGKEWQDYDDSARFGPNETLNKESRLFLLFLFTNQVAGVRKKTFTVDMLKTEIGEFTAQQWARKLNQQEILDCLYKQTQPTDSSLKTAVACHQPIKLMLEQKMLQMDKEDQYGIETNLVLAVRHSHHELARYILENYKTNVNHTSFTGELLLLLAVQNNDLDMVKILIEKGGANPYLFSDNDVNPVVYAGFKGYFAILRYFLEEVKFDLQRTIGEIKNLPRPEAKEDNTLKEEESAEQHKTEIGYLLLCKTIRARDGHPEIVKYLIETCHVTAESKFTFSCYPPLLAPIERQDLAMVKFLVERGKANVNAIVESYMKYGTMLDYAEQGSEIYFYLKAQGALSREALEGNNEAHSASEAENSDAENSDTETIDEMNTQYRMQKFFK